MTTHPLSIDDSGKVLEIPKFIIAPNQQVVMTCRLHFDPAAAPNDRPFLANMMVAYLHNATWVNGSWVIVLTDELVTNQARSRLENGRLIVEP